MAAFFSGDAVGAVVADLGHHDSKIGWAGSDFPKSYFRSNVAVLHAEQGAAKADDTRNPISKIKYDYYHRPILHDQNSDGNWQVANPVDLVSGLHYDPQPHLMGGADWADLTPQLLEHGYSVTLKAKMEDHPLLLVERAYNPPPIRQELLEIAMETCQVPAAFLGKDAVLSCYGCGRTSATVVDIGYSGTTVSPVVDGFVEQPTIRRSPMGGYEMDRLILEQLDKLQQKTVLPLYQVRRPKHTTRAAPIHVAARLMLAQECRETGAGAAINTTAATNFAAPHKTFELPDGTSVDIPSAHRFAVSALLLGSDDASAARRTKVVAAHQQILQERITAAEHYDDGEKKDDNDERYSEAASVGLSKRRKTKRRVGSSSDPGTTKKATTTTTTAVTEYALPGPLPTFSNRLLLHAVAPYLQTHLDTHLTPHAIPQMICDAAYACDREQQAMLLANVIVGGGGACLGPSEQAVPDAIKDGTEALIHVHTPGWRVKTLSPPITERAVLPWLGGSILASMGTFHEMWISRAEYDEWGAAIVNRKCP